MKVFINGREVLSDAVFRPVPGMDGPGRFVTEGELAALFFGGPMTDDQPTDDIVLPDDDLDSDELGDPDVDTDRVDDGH
jgi:hypothetical protein